jgi:hypothetical protein
MATILFNNVETTPIPYMSSNNTSIHNPNGVDAIILKTALWENYMISFSMSYNLLKNNWTQLQEITTANESSLLESLIVHSYDADLFEKYGRKFNEMKLVDLVELNLKNMKDYLQAIKSFIEYYLNAF